MSKVTCARAAATARDTLDITGGRGFSLSPKGCIPAASFATVQEVYLKTTLSLAAASVTNVVGESWFGLQ